MNEYLSIQKDTRLKSAENAIKMHASFAAGFCRRQFIYQRNNGTPPCLVDCANRRDTVKGKFQFIKVHFLTPFLF